MEKINCDLCGGDDRTQKIVYTERGYPVVVCKTCGLCFVNPRITETEYIRNLDVSYSELANPEFTPPEDDLSRKEYLDYKQKESAIYLEKVKRFVRQGALLDSGCGEGLFLDYAMEHGFDGYGCEPSKSHVPSEHIMKSLKGFYNAGLEGVQEKSELFDVITMWDSFEHVRFPGAILKNANRLLKKNGILVIKVPNFQWLYIKAKVCDFAIKRSRFLAKKVFNNLGFFAPETHLFNYSDRSLKQYMKKHGFTPIASVIVNTPGTRRKIALVIKGLWSLFAAVVYYVSFNRINLNISLCIIGRKTDP